MQILLSAGALLHENCK